MSLQTTLYPPILATYMSAFVSEDSNGSLSDATCRIRFTMPAANDVSAIEYVQVSVRSQATNLSMLNEEKYPCEVMLTNLRQDENTGVYFIEIPVDAMYEERFELNAYYKVQLRFVDAQAEAVSPGYPQSIATWLTNNLNYFSEWSTVTLIRSISQPTLYLYGYDADGIAVSFGQTSNVLLGKMTFSNELDKESLGSYEVTLYDDETNEALVSSGVNYTNDFNDPNVFYYSIAYALEFSHNYRLVVNYQTTNQFSGTETIEFTSMASAGDVENITLGVFPDDAEGRMKLNLRRLTNLPLTGAIYIKRASSETDFKIWEDWKILDCSEVTDLRETFYDYTIESGVWYRYGIQIRTGETGYTSIKYSKTPKIVQLDDMFLAAQGRQLNVKFNPTITSFKKTYSEVKVDTIGSKYPFFKRSGATNYATFPIGGLISTSIDEAETFFSKDDVYGNNKSLYENYNLENGITIYNDYFLENKFKHEVLEFLNSGDTFLFRSATEGNYLIKILNGASLTPNTTLGRRLWSFTSTAYEVMECTLANMIEAGIHTKNESRYGEGVVPPVESDVIIQLIYTSSDSGSEETIDLSSWASLKTMIRNRAELWTGSMKIIYNGAASIDFEGMFNGCSNVTSIDLSEVNSTRITTLLGMCLDCSSLKSIDLTNFLLTSAESTEQMFEGCTSLTTLTNFADMGLGNITTMRRMFWGCKSLRSMDLSGFNISRNTSLFGMFGDCISLNSFEWGDFDTSKVTTFASMFYNCASLKALDLSTINTGSVTNGCANNFLYGCSSLTDISILTTDVLFKEDTMGTLQLPFNSGLAIEIPVGLVPDYSAHSLWKDYIAYLSPEEITVYIEYQTAVGGTTIKEEFNSYSEMDTRIRAIKSTFKGHLKVAYKGDVNVPSVAVDELLASMTEVESIDLTEFETHNFTSMKSFFSGCTNVVTIETGDWDMSNLTDITYMFRNCKKLTSVDVTNWDLRVVENLTSVFYGCTALTSLDLTGWYVTAGKVITASNFATGCSSLLVVKILNDYMLEFPNTALGLTNVTIIVPDGWEVTYQNTTPWSYYTIKSVSGFLGTSYSVFSLIEAEPTDDLDEQIEMFLELGVDPNAV